LSARRRVPGKSLPHGKHILAESIELRDVRLASRSNGDVESGPDSQRWKQFYADELAEPAFQAVPFD
jgi:hypothetical protein